MHVRRDSFIPVLTRNPAEEDLFVCLVGGAFKIIAQPCLALKLAIRVKSLHCALGISL